MSLVDRRAVLAAVVVATDLAVATVAVATTAGRVAVATTAAQASAATTAARVAAATTAAPASTRCQLDHPAPSQWPRSSSTNTNVGARAEAGLDRLP